MTPRNAPKNGLYQETKRKTNSGAMGHPPSHAGNEKEEGHTGIVRRGSGWERKEVNSVLTILIPVGPGLEGRGRSESLGSGG